MSMSDLDRSGCTEVSVDVLCAAEPMRCTSCCDLLQMQYVQCAECPVADDIHLCVPCFTLGVELGAHKRHHNYRVLNMGGVPIFEDTDKEGLATTDEKHPVHKQSAHEQGHSASLWSSTQEVALLVAVERFNLGNWEDVAPLVCKWRTVEQVKHHYDKYYLRGRIGQISTRAFERPTILDDTDNTYECNATDTKSCTAPNIFSLTSPPNSPPIKQSTCKVNNDDLRLLAYMPQRDDFEKEWNNEAEEMVSKLMLMPDDDQLDKAVKVAIVESYVDKTRKRRKLKALARDYDLVPTFFKQERPGTTKKQLAAGYAKQKRLEDEIRLEYKRFAQFMPAKEFDELIHGLLKERRLKDRVQQLQEYRKNGVTSLQEAGLLWIDFEPGSLISALQRLESLRIQANVNNSSSRVQSRSSNEARRAYSPTTNNEKAIFDGTDSVAGRNVSPTKPNEHSTMTLLSQSEIQVLHSGYCNNDDEDVSTCSSIADQCINNNNTNVNDNGDECNNTSAVNQCTPNTAALCSTYDYVLVKLALLNEQQLKLECQPIRTNVKEQVTVLKDKLRPFMAGAGWLHQDLV